MAEEQIIHLEDWQQATIEALGEKNQRILAENRRVNATLARLAQEWGGEGYEIIGRDGEVVLVRREEPEKEGKE